MPRNDTETWAVTSAPLRKEPPRRPFYRWEQTLSYTLLSLLIGFIGFAIGRRFQQTLDRHNLEADISAGAIHREVILAAYHLLKHEGAPVGEDSKYFESKLPLFVKYIQEGESARQHEDFARLRENLAKGLRLPENASVEQIRSYLEQVQEAGESAAWSAMRGRVNLALGAESSLHMKAKAATIQDRAMWLAFDAHFPPSAADIQRASERLRQQFARNCGLSRTASWQAIRAWIEQRENANDTRAFNRIRLALGFDTLPTERIASAAWRHLHSLLNRATPMKFSQTVSASGSHL